MALPFSRSTTYQPSTAPTIKSQDLNDMQDYIGGIYSASKSIIGLKIDGIGNGAGPAAAAQLDVGQSVLSDNALALFRDKAGNIRSIIDHLGYPSGRLYENRENWDFSLATNTAITLASVFGGSGYSRWNARTTNGTRNTISTHPTGGLAGSYITMLSSAAAGSDLCLLYGQSPWVQLATYTSLMMDFEVFYGSPAGSTLVWGLTDMNNGAGNAPSNSTPWVGLAARRDTSTNLQMIHGDGTTLIYTDLGVAIDPLAATWVRIRIELHGTGSPYGACARIFVNDVQLGGNITTNIPTVANLSGVGLTPQFGQAVTAASNASAGVGPVRLRYNMVALSSPQV